MNISTREENIFQTSITWSPHVFDHTSLKRSRPERFTPLNLSFSDCTHLMISVRVNLVSISSSSFLLLKTSVIPSTNPYNQSNLKRGSWNEKRTCRLSSQFPHSHNYIRLFSACTMHEHRLSCVDKERFKRHREAYETL